MPSCDVIIVNYNAGELLSKNLNAVRDSLQSLTSFVIDNNSSDDSISQIKSNKDTKIILRKENHGFAKSCNYGSKIGNSEYICFLNPDCIVDKSTLPTLLKSLSQNQNIAMIGCLIRNPDGSEQRATRRRTPSLWRTIMTVSKLEKMARILPFLAGVNLSHKAMPTELKTVEAISGALMLVRRDVFEKLNGFDESYPMHFEDLDLMTRIRNLGYDIGFNPKVSAVHHQGESSKSNPNVNKMKRQGLERYFRKHGSKTSYYIVKIMLKVTK